MAAIRDNGGLRCRRICDILIACLALAFLLPLIGAVVLAIRAKASGPVLRRRLRIRRDGRWIRTFEFSIAAHDGRGMSRVRIFLRRTRIDTLPQALDVLRGDLTFIGNDRPGFLMR